MRILMGTDPASHSMVAHSTHPSVNAALTHSAAAAAAQTSLLPQPKDDDALSTTSSDASDFGGDDFPVKGDHMRVPEWQAYLTPPVAANTSSEEGTVPEPPADIDPDDVDRQLPQSVLATLAGDDHPSPNLNRVSSGWSLAGLAASAAMPDEEEEEHGYDIHHDGSDDRHEPVAESPVRQHAEGGSSSSGQDSTSTGRRSKRARTARTSPETSPSMPSSAPGAPSGQVVATTSTVTTINIPSIETKFPCRPVQVAVVQGSNGLSYLQALFAVEDIVTIGASNSTDKKPPPPAEEEDAKDSAGNARSPTVKVRKYANPTSSRFCHICARSSRGVVMAVCQNVRHGVCRKVVCEKCCDSHGWEFIAPTPAVLRGEEASGFVCAHCKGLCPDRAQCNTYKRTNQRRRMRGAEKRRAIEVAMANGDDVGAILKGAPSQTEE